MKSPSGFLTFSQVKKYRSRGAASEENCRHDYYFCVSSETVKA